jgi:hypothetical protein
MYYFGHRNEIFGSMKCVEFTGQFSEYQLLMKNIAPRISLFN